MKEHLNLNKSYAKIILIKCFSELLFNRQCVLHFILHVRLTTWFTTQRSSYRHLPTQYWPSRLHTHIPAQRHNQIALLTYKYMDTWSSSGGRRRGIKIIPCYFCGIACPIFVNLLSSSRKISNSFDIHLLSFVGTPDGIVLRQVIGHILMQSIIVSNFIRIHVSIFSGYSSVRTKNSVVSSHW